LKEGALAGDQGELRAFSGEEGGEVDEEGGGFGLEFFY
jgi:hypothetical protein